MGINKDDNNHPKAGRNPFRKLFPFFKKEQQSLPLVSPPSEGGLWAGTPADYHNSILGSRYGDHPLNPLAGGEDVRYENELPQDRQARYALFSLMAGDPTISTSIKMHVSQALSSNSRTGEIVSVISATGNDNDAIVDDLKNCLEPLIRKNVKKWAYSAAIYGFSPVRVYGAPGVGITRLRHDYYTLPNHVKIYEKGGEIFGYSSPFQKNNHASNIMTPWSFVCFRLPSWAPAQVPPEIAGSGQIYLILRNQRRSRWLKRKIMVKVFWKLLFRPGLIFRRRLFP